MSVFYVVEGEANEERSYEIFSRLLKDRIIYVQGEFNDVMANNIVAQLLYLSSRDSEKPIYMYINSPGGSISSLYAIVDCMDYITPDIHTLGIGSVCSAGSFLLASGTKNHRKILKNTSVMIHELSSGVQGKAGDIFNEVKHMERLYEKMARQYASFTGKSITKIKKDMQRDFWMDAQEALDYGLVDQII